MSIRFENRAQSLASIDLATMPDLEYLDCPGVIVNRIHDPVISLPNPVSFLSRQLLAALRPRFFPQRPDPFENPPQVLFGDPLQFVGRGFPDEELISSHRA